MRVVTFGRRGHRLTEMAFRVVSELHLEQIAHIDAEHPDQEPPPADLYLSAAFTRILREEVLGRAGTALNVHPSLLPTYAGSHPVYWAMYEGATVSGVTIHEMTVPVDSGPIVAQEAMTINPLDEPSVVYEGITRLARITLKRTLSALLIHGRLPSRPQEGERIFRGPPSKEVDRLVLDWSDPAREVVRRTRIFPRWVNFEEEGERIFVSHAEVAGPVPAGPGTILRRKRRAWTIAAGDGVAVRVTLRDLKPTPFQQVLNAWFPGWLEYEIRK